MRYQALWFLSAVFVSSSAVAESPARTWVLDAGEIYLEQAGKPRRAITLPEWHWAGEAYACAPVVATGPRGEAVVTSNVLPVLWKIDPDTLAVTVHRLELDADNDKDVGFSGIVYSDRDGAYFAVSELQGSLWRIDPLLRRAQKVALSEPVRGACSVSMRRQEPLRRFSTLCLDGRYVNLAPDQRSAYVQATGCSADAFAFKGGAR